MTVLHLHTCTTRKQKTKTCSSIFIIITKNKLKPKKEREKESKSSHWVLLLHCFAFALKNKETSTVQNRTFHNISNPKPIFHWAGTFFLSWLCSVLLMYIMLWALGLLGPITLLVQHTYTCTALYLYRTLMPPI